MYFQARRTAPRIATKKQRLGAEDVERLDLPERTFQNRLDALAAAGDREGLKNLAEWIQAWGTRLADENRASRFARQALKKAEEI